MEEDKNIFSSELEVFRGEVSEAIQYFYAYLSIHASLSDNKKALQIVNKAPMLWKTVLGALSTSFFIVLGRIFDQNSKHNIDRLIKVAQNNTAIFSKEALEVRKRSLSKNADEWIKDYIKDVYEPQSGDFRRLRRHVFNYRKIYENRYRDIRRKIHAHKELSKLDDMQKLFNNTNIREMEKLSIFLNKLHGCLWELYHNGKKPILRPMRYSVKSMRKSILPDGWNSHVQEHMVQEVEKFFRIISPERKGK